MRPLFAVTLLAIVHFSLHPWRFDFSRLNGASLQWLGIASPSDLTDIALNLVFYLFPALLAQWTLSPSPRLPSSLLLTAAFALLSLTVEFLQLAIPGRHPNLRDVFCNTLGAAAGVALAFVLPPPHRLFASWRLPPQFPTLLVILLAWTTWLTLPFIPHIRLYRLLQLHQPFLQPLWYPAEMVDIFLALFLIHFIAHHLLLPALPITLAAALLIPAQGFLRNVQISPSRVVAGSLALLLLALFFRRPSPALYRPFALLFTLWLILRQLTPFTFSPQPLQPFAWLPFGSIVDLSRPSSLRILSQKFLLYGGPIWLWRQSGLTAPRATLAILLPLALTEALQCFLPGRSPETTDLVLALLAAWLLLAPQKPVPTQTGTAATPSVAPVPVVDPPAVSES